MSDTMNQHSPSQLEAKSAPNSYISMRAKLEIQLLGKFLPSVLSSKLNKALDAFPPCGENTLHNFNLWLQRVLTYREYHQFQYAAELSTLPTYQLQDMLHPPSSDPDAPVEIPMQDIWYSAQKNNSKSVERSTDRILRKSRKKVKTTHSTFSNNYSALVKAYNPPFLQTKTPKSPPAAARNKITKADMDFLQSPTPATFSNIVTPPPISSNRKRTSDQMVPSFGATVSSAFESVKQRRTADPMVAPQPLNNKKLKISRGTTSDQLSLEKSLNVPGVVKIQPMPAMSSGHNSCECVFSEDAGVLSDDCVDENSDMEVE